MLKKITGVIALLIILTGCKDSGSPTVTAGSLPSLTFANGQSQLTIYRSQSQTVNFSCHPELQINKIEIDGVEINPSTYLLAMDMACGDQAGYFKFPQEVFDVAFSVNIFTQVGAMQGTTSQIFIKDTPNSELPQLDTINFSVNEDEVLTDQITMTSPDGSQITVALEQTTVSGSLIMNADGSFDYTPNTDFNGTDFFTVKAINNSGETQKTYQITVNSVNDLPQAEDKSVSLMEK